ncbi:VWA domain-containing protein [Microvirga sp. BT688]|uniref:vWA domain-containing protein n=1 Tax=Microvirga sp. TaxID=1873136 RepID=UPI0016835281|nr:vWA domain-containing protein [Microvirga sp.]MBD2745795.1 VWA domain-containing protein [Microvirga sp.]
MSMIPGYILRREITSTLSAMGNRRFHILFRGDQAFTDGLNIVLPAIWPQSQYNEADAKILRGYGNHEVFHPLYSTLAARLPWIERAIGAPVSQMDKAQKFRLRLFIKTENCAEDYRIESLGGKAFPGSHVNIGFTRNHIVARELKELQARDQTTAPRLIPNVHQALTWFGTVANGYPCAPTAQVAIEYMRAHVDQEAIDIVEHYWPLIVRCRTNPDIYPIALHLSDLLIRLSHERRSKEPARACDPSPEATPSVPTGDNPGLSRGEGANTSASSGPGPSSSGSLKSDFTPALKEQLESDAAADRLDAPLLDISDVVARVVDRTRVDVRAYRQAVAEAEAAGRLPSQYRRAFSRPLMIAPSTPEAGDDEAFRTVMETASRDATTLSAAVRSLLLSRQRKVVRRHRLEGELDDQNIMGIAMGEPDVFRRIQRGTGSNAAVQFMLDVSRSMLSSDVDPEGARETSKRRATRLDILLQATGAVIEAVGHQRQIDLAIDSFTTDEDLNPTIVRHKQFGEPPSRMRPAVGSVLRRQRGGTPTAEAILEGAHQLFRLRHPKKVLILVTDGEANDPIAAEEAAQVAIASGIHLIGIGIGKDAPTLPIPGWLTINHVSDLPNQLLEAMRRFL